jgi:hypothetical protein
MGKEIRQILYFLEKRMSVAEICYNMHASSFHIYAQLYDLVSKGIARVVGEAAPAPEPAAATSDLPEATDELLWIARRELKEDNVEMALTVLHQVLDREPKNEDAQALLKETEERFIKNVYKSDLSPQSIPNILIQPDTLTHEQISPQEGFLLSRINGVWDVESILSICPFREADSLRMMKTLLDKKIIGL